MADIEEKIAGIVQRVTYHNPDNGWSVLRLAPFSRPGTIETVTVHQTRVFAGATMEFHGSWTVHPKYGRQFTATRALEKKPATTAALEKYIGSGLIYGVGPKIARRIVKHFGERTLEIFEEDIDRLMEVEGIATKKLESIRNSWREHRMVREVMMFLQSHDISTLFAVRIYQKYGERAIEIVSRDPYRLALDFYGIGFFSADRVALSLGFAEDSEERIGAAIRHVLAASREQGHCYLTLGQIVSGVDTLLDFSTGSRIESILGRMEQERQLMVRRPDGEEGSVDPENWCYYSRTLYFDELEVGEAVSRLAGRPNRRISKLEERIGALCGQMRLQLSKEQAEAVRQAVLSPFSVLTGGPGCGKTTTTLIIVRLLEQLGRRVILGAPTGRAAQRMGEVIGREAKTLHRMLEWKGGEFVRNGEHPLQGDYLIVDECSMLDISLTASLLRAVPSGCQVLFIGDADQLPSVGAGNVQRDIIGSGVVPVLRLTRIFRQAANSKIITFAHQINRGETPRIGSPFKQPQLWKAGEDCLFLDSDEATQEQLRFINRVKTHFGLSNLESLESLTGADDYYVFRTAEPIKNSWEPEFEVPKKFAHVDLERVLAAKGEVEELKAVLSRVHPWSTLHYGLTAVESVVRLYLEWIPKYYGPDCEIQILSPMTRGSLGTANLNRLIQQRANPPGPGKPELSVGERIFRVGDRVIHRRNNYDLGVFNGDIGKIVALDNEQLSCVVEFLPDGRRVEYEKDHIVELDLAYAITIHKSQGSEFGAVILPLHTQHFRMLFRNLFYTGLTRAKKLAVVVGTRRAMAMAVKQQDTALRQTWLQELLRRERGIT